jgi:pyruvate dehydrogenase E2 component (dihydrolipoamide acetyltransferase)
MAGPDGRIQRVTMPKWGLSMTTGRITDWLVREGAEVRAGDDLAEIDTDKIVGVLPAPGDGVLRRVLVPVGGDAPVGATIAVLAPAQVSDADLEPVVAEAVGQLAGGVVPEESGGLVVRTVEVAGRRISHAVLGPGAGDGAGDCGGEVVLLLHGYGGDANSWLFVQEPLARAGRTVYALDLPGHGASGKDVGDGSVAGLAGTVLAFCDAVGAKQVHLVGHSLGGAVAVAAAAAAPERVRSLTLVAPAGFGPDINAAYLRGFAAATTRRELRPVLGDLFADPAQVTRQLVEDLLRYKRLDGVPAALTTLLGTLLAGDRQRIDVSGLLAGLAVPVAVVWGAADAVIPSRRALGEVPVTVVAGAGHLVHLEQPSAVVAAAESAIRPAAPA